MRTIPELLEKAADVIEERGWFRGHYQDPCGSGVCLVGAVSVAAGIPPNALGVPREDVDQDGVMNTHAAVTEFEHWLTNEHDFDELIDATDWNDELAEDAAAVATNLRLCAADARKARP